MATKLYSLIPIALIVSFCINSGSSLPCPGCLELDELSFGKILRKFNTLLVKFDSAYPFGDKHEQYARFSAQVTPDNENLAIGLIGVKDYGDKDNMALANKYQVGDNYPAIKLFQNGDAENWIDFPKGKEVQVNGIQLQLKWILFRRSQRDCRQSEAICPSTCKCVYGIVWMCTEIWRFGCWICARSCKRYENIGQTCEQCREWIEQIKRREGECEFYHWIGGIQNEMPIFFVIRV